MELKELQRNWNAFGETDPLFAILTEPSKQGGRWNEREFFQKGIEEIDGVMKYLRSLGVEVRRGEAFDFGCGVGRLTQALCRHFDRAAGVDIAPSMVRLARQYNKFGERCQYYLNEVNNLSLFNDASFDFVYSYIVLQHMRPEYAKNYIRDFFRILAPGGVAVFQMPTVPGEWERLAKPIPDTAFRAKIVAIDVPAVVESGAHAIVRAKVRNEGDALWPAMWNQHGQYAVTLGNHWLDAEGAMLMADDGRTHLARDMAPGDELEFTLSVKAPQQPGRYVLELDMVQEQYTWFQNKGSASERFEIQVRPPRRRLSEIFRKVVKPWAASSLPAPETSNDFAPAMEMYGIEQPEIEELVKQCGARLLDVQMITPSSNWVHARYYVAK